MQDGSSVSLSISLESQFGVSDSIELETKYKGFVEQNL